MDSDGQPTEDCLRPVRIFLRKNSLTIGGCVLGSLVIGIWFAWAAFGAHWAVEKICASSSDCSVLGKLGQVGDLFGGINALFAALAFIAVAISGYQAARTYRLDRQLEHDEIYVKQIQMSYEWAYSVFAPNGEPPLQGNAEAWLTAARHLIRAAAIEALVETEAHRIILAEHKEYWRRRFYTTLDRLSFSGRDVSIVYFGDHVAQGDYFRRESRFDITAAKVVIDFSQWDEDVPDPLDWARDHGNFRNWMRGRVGRGLRAHLEEMALVREAARQRESRNTQNIG